MKRSEALAAINKASEEPEGFLKLIRSHVSPRWPGKMPKWGVQTASFFFNSQGTAKEPFSITEFLQSLSKKQHLEVWTSLLSLVRQSVSQIAEEADQEGDGEDENDATPTSHKQVFWGC